MKQPNPIPLWKSILFFGIPGGVLYIFVYSIIPMLINVGIPLFWIFMVGISAAGAFFMGLSIFLAVREGNAHSWNILKNRFRIKRMTAEDLLWVGGIVLFSAASGTLLSFTSRWLASIPFFTPPDYIPAIMNPAAGRRPDSSVFMGISLTGRWYVVPVWAMMLFFNVFGEEFLWRGYLLPRQEFKHGKHAWIIHGVLWTLFHFIWKWNLVAMLPVCLALSYAVHKAKNTSIGIAAHFVMNGFVFWPIVSGIVA